MDKHIIITKLREHETQLRAAGIEHLFLHGSYPRAMAIREKSDVDVIAEFAPGRPQLSTIFLRSVRAAVSRALNPGSL